jgi:hypothetical protein
MTNFLTAITFPSETKLAEIGLKRVKVRRLQKNRKKCFAENIKKRYLSQKLSHGTPNQL